jgi:hypothetical protein
MLKSGLTVTNNGQIIRDLQMKVLRIILISFSLLVILAIGGILFLNRHAVITYDQVMARFEKAGGVDEVNKEAEIIFNIFGTNDVFVLQEFGIPHLNDCPEMKKYPEIKNFPAIFALGDVVMVQGGSLNNAAPEIYVRYGKHNQAKTIDIFPPNIDADKTANFYILSFLKDPSYLRVTNNIFAWKGRY